ncbi:dynamin family protein [Myxosarcina sp. GI1]|uniref:dynamin family protein n=1 Tax=Myxosarcina sp. GI1 TaxID=1541065 RepID=UPI000561D1EA|nr:dynamin family protein [Myxosarcina sp. GI1]
MPLTISTEQQQLFDRSLKTIEKVEGLFVEAKELFPEFNLDINAFKQQLSNPFSIFICGEFNAGKSSLLNRLNNQEIATVGFLPTTKSIESYNPEGLGGLVFIDSPGINSIIEQHQELTESYLQQADIILFVTSIERPLSKSEQDFLAIVDRTWDRKIIVVINKIDLIDERQIEEVIKFVNNGLKVILAEMPPVFALSAETGTGMDEFKNFLLAFLAESEKVKLKLRGPQSSLLVYLDKLQQKNQELQNKLQTEKTLFDRTSKRIEERLEEYNLLFGLFKDNIEDLFTALIQGVNELIDSNTSFFTVLKRKFTKEEDLLEERLAKTIKDIQLDKNLQEIFKEATFTFLKYRERIVREAKEDLETAVTITEDSFIVPAVNAESLEVEQLAERIKAAAEMGLDRFVKLGITAAATGVGGQILFSTASVDLTAFAVAGFFGLLGLNAIPNERKKAKEELEINFRNLQENYTKTLKDTLAAELNKCLQQFADIIRPKQEELENQINITKSIQQQEEAIRTEIQTLLTDVEKL